MSLKTFLNPKSIAIIGASRNKKKLGWQILDNIKSNGFKGKIYPVNLSEKSIDGLETYNSIGDINEPVDLAVVVIPAQAVIPIIRECGLAQVKNIIVVSAGFSELGKEGGELEKKIRALAQDFGLNILGPNCLGIIGGNNNLNVTFAKSKIKKGNVAFLSQSGAIGSAALDWVQDKDFGFSYFISLGNKADLDENDFFEYFKEDKETEIVVAYLEEIENGLRFMEVVSKLSKIKPVVILKSGRSELGSKAALSHTGSLAGSNEAVLAGFKRANVINVETIEEIFSLIKFFQGVSTLRKEAGMSKDIFIVSNAGGPMVTTVDLISKHGLGLGKFSSDVLKKLQINLPKVKAINNPLDIIGDADAERYQKALEIILENDKIQNLLVLLTPQTTTESEKTAEIISVLGKKYKNKLICTSFIGGKSLLKAKSILGKGRIVNFNYPSQAVNCFHKYLNYKNGLKSLRPYISTYDSNELKFCSLEPRLVDYLETFKVLKKYKIDSAKIMQIDEKDFHKIEKGNIKFPIAMKVVGPNLIHKSDSNSIALNIPNVIEAKKAFQSFSNLLKDRENYCVAQEMVGGGFEMILGFRRDKSFGPIIMIGAGGIYTEILKDIQTEVDDIDLKTATRMIENLKIYPILKGARGQAGYNIKSLALAIVNAAKIAKENGEIQEFDINPLFITRKGVVAADARIIV